MSYLKLSQELKKAANPQRAKISQGFFKTGRGEYGEGDIFLGITVPQSRKIAIKFKDLPFSEIVKLLKSKIHEERLIALLILVNNFNLGDERIRRKIFEFYLQNTKYINNWDLVDLSADKIVGGYLWNFARGNHLPGVPQAQHHLEGGKSGLPRRNHVLVKSSFRKEHHPIFVLTRLARSQNLWERRIAMVATYYFIKNNKFDLTLKIAKILLRDEHDLIQKAVGWMLREVGNRDLETEIKFLNKHYRKMPRTILRYAIEKFPKRLKVNFMAK